MYSILLLEIVKRFEKDGKGLMILKVRNKENLNLFYGFLEICNAITVLQSVYLIIDLSIHSQGRTGLFTSCLITRRGHHETEVLLYMTHKSTLCDFLPFKGQQL